MANTTSEMPNTTGEMPNTTSEMPNTTGEMASAEGETKDPKRIVRGGDEMVTEIAFMAGGIGRHFLLRHS